jgi:hypothetical protein
MIKGFLLWHSKNMKNPSGAPGDHVDEIFIVSRRYGSI